MDVEAGGIVVGEACELEDALGGDAGGELRVGFGEFAAVVGLPVVGKCGELGLALGFGGGCLVVEELLLDGFGFGRGIDADGFGVESGRGTDGL